MRCFPHIFANNKFQNMYKIIFVCACACLRMHTCVRVYLIYWHYFSCNTHILCIHFLSKWEKKILYFHYSDGLIESNSCRSHVFVNRYIVCFSNLISSVSFRVEKGNIWHTCQHKIPQQNRLLHQIRPRANSALCENQFENCLDL